MLNICGFCGTGFHVDELLTACPICEAELSTATTSIEPVRRWTGELREPWLYRITFSRLIGIHEVAELGSMMVELQRAFNLEPGRDLAACIIDANAPALEAVMLRLGDGTFARRDMRGAATGMKVMVFRDGRGVFYHPSCSAALLMGWRSGAGDA